MAFSTSRLRRLARAGAGFLLAASMPVFGQDAGAPGAQVEIENYAFKPNEIHVKAGSVVTWINHDDSPHTIEEGDFTSEMIDPDQSFSRVYASPGTYGYVCGLHPAHMTGKIIVTP